MTRATRSARMAAHRARSADLWVYVALRAWPRAWSRMGDLRGVKWVMWVYVTFPPPGPAGRFRLDLDIDTMDLGP